MGFAFHLHRTKSGWLYLTVIMDLFDRKIVGWDMSKGMTAVETVIVAWNMAIKNRSVRVYTMIFHSDRGVRYASHEFLILLKAAQIRESMRRKGNCRDNAVRETSPGSSSQKQGLILFTSLLILAMSSFKSKISLNLDYHI